MRQPSPANTATSNQGRGIASNRFQQQTVGVVVDEVELGLVEGGSGVSLGNGQTNSVADTLAKGASGDLNARGVMSLGVSGGLAANTLQIGPSVQLR